MDTKIAVVTVLFENYTILDDYFASLSKQTDQNFHIYIIDLTPKPKQYIYPPYVSYMHYENKGYAFGINKGIQAAIKDNYFQFSVMNCDVVLKEDFIKNTKQSIQENPSSIIGGKIYYYPGNEYHKDRYTQNDVGHILWYAGGKTDWKNITINHRGVDEIDKGQYDTFQQTDFITGCLMNYDLSVFKKIGNWDESYFLFFEDTDYCIRAIKTGIKLYYDPHIILWHKSGQSTDGPASPFQQRYMNRNRLRFGLKYAPVRTKIHLLKNAFFGKR